MIWLAILITVVSSTSCSVGKALQKEAVSAGGLSWVHLVLVALRL